MLIWAHGLGPEVNPMRELYESLTAIGKRNVAGKNVIGRNVVTKRVNRFFQFMKSNERNNGLKILVEQNIKLIYEGGERAKLNCSSLHHRLLLLKHIQK